MGQVEGDVNCAVLLVAHSTLLECDLVYVHEDGEGSLLMDKQRFRSLNKEDWGERLFKLATLSKPVSPNGFLPPYRYSMMDPASMGPMIGLRRPASDGSSCSLMSRSLRNILSQEYNEVAGVHCNIMSREQF